MNMGMKWECGYKHIDYDKLSYEANKEEIIKAHNAINQIIKEEPKYLHLHLELIMIIQ